MIIEIFNQDILIWNKHTCSFSALNSHLDCLKYAYENGQKRSL